MPDSSAAFVGSIPATYDRHLGRLLFHQYADDLVERLVVRPGMRVLETACGTGIVTRRLVKHLGPDAALVATDLNQAMIDHARTQVAPDATIEWIAADATSLPFADRSFDAVVCQFGLMFYPDKAAGVTESFRVLTSGGIHLFNVWDAIEHNEVARIADETVTAFFPDDPPRFYAVPYGFYDRNLIRSLLIDAGFERVDLEVVDKVGVSPSAADAATGYIEGNPMLHEILNRRPEALAEIKATLAHDIAARLGDHPVRSPLRAIVVTAHRPV